MDSELENIMDKIMKERELKNKIEELGYRYNEWTEEYTKHYDDLYCTAYIEMENDEEYKSFRCDSLIQYGDRSGCNRAGVSFLDQRPDLHPDEPDEPDFAEFVRGHSDTWHAALYPDRQHRSFCRFSAGFYRCDCGNSAGEPACRLPSDPADFSAGRHSHRHVERHVDCVF